MFKFDLLENEKPLAMFRQTEWVLLKPVCLVFVLIYIPWYFLIKYELAADFSRILLIWTLLVFLYAVYKYLVWLLNSFLLTDKRVVCINYIGLTKKKISETSLEKIANIGVTASGAFQSMFGFGNVEVHIVNSPHFLILNNIREPIKIKDMLWKAHQKYANGSSAGVHTSPVLSDNQYAR